MIFFAFPGFFAGAFLDVVSAAVKDSGPSTDAPTHAMTVLLMKSRFLR
jgi:hypothetical protein